MRRRWVIDDIKLALGRFHQIIKVVSLVYNYMVFILNYNNNKSNQTLKNKHRGETCFILGNGISLDQIPVEEINKHTVFACNEIFYHNQFNTLRIDYYTVIEPYYGKLFGRDYYEDTHKLYKDIDASFAEKETVFLLHSTVRKLIKYHSYQKNRTIFYLAPINKIINSLHAVKNDMAGVFNLGFGAIGVMVGASVYMGFNNIVLLGCGYTYRPRQQHHFYARPQYNKTKHSYDEMIQMVKEFAKTHNLILMKIDENQDYYYPVFGKEDSNDSTTMNYLKIKKLSIENKVEIVNVHPEGFDSTIFKGYTWQQYKEKYK